MHARNLLVAALAACSFTAALADGYPLKIEAVADEDGAWDVVAHNKGPAPIYIRLTIKNGANVRASSQTTQNQKVLEPGARETLLVAIPADPAEKMSFEYDTTWVFGRGTLKGEHDGLYRPPFPADLTFETLNSADGVHNERRMAHAVDIMMPEGTPVIAARSGYVMDVRGEARGDRVKDGLYPTYETEHPRMGNYVRIVHEDGTFAEYLHLKDASVRVFPGQRVEAGTEIGLSGATGGPFPPHLHFAVMKPQMGFTEPISVPVKIDMAGRGVLVAKAGAPIGAAASVMSDATVVQTDPLVVAPTARRAVSAASGQSAARVSPRAAFGFAMQALLAVLGVLAAGVAGFYIRRRKLGLPLLKRAKQKGDAADIPQGASDVDGGSWPVSSEAVAQPVSARPKRGYLFADWEEPLHGSLSLALQIGYSVHAKVSLNRILARPPMVLENPAAYAILRGDSLDYLIVRNRDSKIVVAIDVDSGMALSEDHRVAKALRAAMLASADIRVVKLRPDAGPQAIRDALADYMKPEASHTEFGNRIEPEKLTS